jgi:flagellar biosynthesis protein FlhG
MKSQLEHFASQMLQSTQTRSVAIASGKGGVGKSTLAVNLAIKLAQQQRLLLLDADPGLADLHIFLGLSPEYHWGDYLQNKIAASEMLTPVRPGLDLVHGFSGVSQSSLVEEEAIRKVQEGIQQISGDYDSVLVDLGAGLSPTTMVFASTADLLVLVLNGELTSLADAYSTLKSVLQWNPRQKVGLVINQAKDVNEARSVWSSLVRIADQFLKVRPPMLGWLPVDTEVPKSLAKQHPIVERLPQSPYAQAVANLAEIITRAEWYADKGAQ